MLVHAASVSQSDQRDRLSEVLADLSITGDILGVITQGTLQRCRLAMTGAKKVSRVKALAPDIATSMDVLHVEVTQLDEDGLIELALLTRPLAPPVSALMNVRSVTGGISLIM